MNVKFLDLKKNYLSIKNEIDDEFNNLFIHCDFIQGSKVKIFENNFSNYIGVNHFIGCANGTDALEIAIKSLEINGNDDEIIIQGNTYIATCLGAVNNNIKVVLCDIEPNTHMIDINMLKNKISKKTRAIIVVHLYGLVPDMEQISNICKENNLFLIEDCAQAHGAKWNGQNVGTFGDLSCFSFYPGKNLGAYGDAGGIGTNSDELNEKMRKIGNLGCKVKYHHELIGRNSRLDTIQAGVLDVKLKHLEEWNKARRKNAKCYDLHLADIEHLQVPMLNEKCLPVYHLYVIKTKFRDELKAYLEKNNIQCLIHYPISIIETEAMKNCDFSDVDNCIKNSNEILSLPMYPELTETEIIYVCDNIKNFFLTNNLIKFKNIITKNKPGILHCINNVNFNMKRLFTIDKFDELNEFMIDYFDLKKQDVPINTRGYHMNSNFNEMLIVLNGKISLKLIDLNMTEKITELGKNEIHFIPKLNWMEFTILDSNTVIIVLADEILSKSESIHDFEVFKNYSTQITYNS